MRNELIDNNKLINITKKINKYLNNTRVKGKSVDFTQVNKIKEIETLLVHSYLLLRIKIPITKNEVNILYRLSKLPVPQVTRNNIGALYIKPKHDKLMSF